MALKLQLFLTPNHASSLQLDSPMAFFQASDQEAKLASTRRTVLSLPAAVLPWRRAPRRGHVIRCASGEVRTFKKQKTAKAETVQVKAIVSVKHDHYTAGGFLTDVADLFGKSLLLELVSTETDPKTELEKDTITAYAHKIKEKDDEVKYEAKFTVPRNFGQIGAVLVTNKHDRELFLKEIFLTGQDDTPITIECNSWVHTYKDNSEKRVFFHNKSYLPSQTPKGLETLRKKELENLRGDGLGERKWFETIYDYDVYNDLGSPDSSPDLARPVLGGKDLPYPRRCRTGRPPTKKDPKSESRNDFIYYVPRDEAFSGVKWATFGSKTVGSVLRSVLPSLVHANLNDKVGFPFFTAIDSLFNEGVNLPKLQDTEGINHIPRLLKALAEGAGQLRFETPEMIDRDKFSWFRDEEFSRQTLAGLNPYSIELVTEFPFVSKLDPEIYGPPESAITAELIESEIKGVMTVEEAIKQKKLFIIDYHDLLLPYVNKVRELKGTTLYGSRTLFFLTHDETLMPIAIELTRPASPTKPQWKQVFTDSWDATGAWLWKLAKVHASAHDSGYHQLVVHWLRTHCCTEPYIIAAHRQLSGMHPIFRLLHPYFRYTMEINALARELLINADGVIESNFSPRKYSIELSSVAYDKLWRFDTQSFPGDLIKRGMAVEDPTAEHGLRLTINDYPFASDGLLLWSAIKQWVSDYVGHFYQDSSSVTSDNELQAWWTEVRTRGHEDKKDEPWWPSLNTASDLTEIITTIIWVTSGHHAAVNFGQYHYAGYFPNRPTIARTNMPVEDGEEDHELFAKFWKKPEQSLMECFPSQMQAVQVMAVLDVLSTHSEEEEYIGKEQFAWTENSEIKAAFERFRGRLLEIEGIIDARNADPKLKNRCGAGIVPYELLKPSSEPGVTGMGVPNSISI